MKFRQDPETDVYANSDGDLVINQRWEACIECGRHDTRFVYFSKQRAREIAAELVRLADELEND